MSSSTSTLTKSALHKDDGSSKKKKKKKRVSFKDPLEREDSDISTQSRHKAHQVMPATLVDISNVLMNPVVEVEFSPQPHLSFNGGYPRPCMKGVCLLCLQLLSSCISVTNHIPYRMFSGKLSCRRRPSVTLGPKNWIMNEPLVAAAHQILRLIQIRRVHRAAAAAAAPAATPAAATARAATAAVTSLRNQSKRRKSKDSK